MKSTDKIIINNKLIEYEDASLKTDEFNYESLGISEPQTYSGIQSYVEMEEFGVLFNGRGSSDYFKNDELIFKLDDGQVDNFLKNRFTELETGIVLDINLNIYKMIYIGENKDEGIKSKVKEELFRIAKPRIKILSVKDFNLSEHTRNEEFAKKIKESSVMYFNQRKSENFNDYFLRCNPHVENLEYILPDLYEEKERQIVKVEPNLNINVKCNEVDGVQRYYATYSLAYNSEYIQPYALEFCKNVLPETQSYNVLILEINSKNTLKSDDHLVVEAYHNLLDNLESSSIKSQIKEIYENIRNYLNNRVSKALNLVLDDLKNQIDTIISNAPINITYKFNRFSYGELRVEFEFSGILSSFMDGEVTYRSLYSALKDDTFYYTFILKDGKLIYEKSSDVINNLLKSENEAFYISCYDYDEMEETQTILCYLSGLEITSSDIYCDLIAEPCDDNEDPIDLPKDTEEYAMVQRIANDTLNNKIYDVLQKAQSLFIIENKLNQIGH